VYCFASVMTETRHTWNGRDQDRAIFRTAGAGRSRENQATVNVRCKERGGSHVQRIKGIRVRKGNCEDYKKYVKREPAQRSKARK